MATGASISINVPQGVQSRLQGAAAQLRKINLQITGIVQKMVAFGAAMKTGGNVNKAYAQSMRKSAKATQQYAVGAASAKGATNGVTNSMQRAAAWTRQMAIGLYVVGGAATSVARPLIAVSMILSTYENFELEWAWFDRWRARVTKGMMRVKNAMKSALVSVATTLRVLKVRFRLMIRQIPGVQAALHSLRMTLQSFGLTINSLVGWMGAIVGVLSLVGMGAAKLSEKFAPISEHIQRAISVSSLAQDQFNQLADSIFSITEALEVFTPKEIASMVERMAYAGAIGENFEKTAMMIGQIAHVTGMEMAEITRDMARLTSQTGESFESMANVILRTFAQASITYEETVDSFQQAGMLLREDLGVTIAQMGAIVVQLEKFGYTGTRAATALRSLAARSSELKEGLRGAKRIFNTLGVTDAVEKFKSGNMSLIELIKTFGDAGASYGHLVQIFNRRAGVAAAAVSEFADEHEEATEKIIEDTADITEMYQKLINTQKGIQARVESQRALAAQKWARALSGVGKSWLYVVETFWKVAGALTGVFKLLNAIVQVGIGILVSKLNLAIWPIHAIIGGLRLVHNIITSLLNLIPGLQIDMDFKDIPGIGWLAKAQDVLIKGGFNFFKSAWESISGFWKDKELEAPEIKEQRESLKKTTKDYKKQILQTSKAMKEFEGMFTSDFIGNYVKSISAFAGEVDALSYTLESKGKEVSEALEKQAYSAKEMKVGKQFDKVTSKIVPVVSSLIKLNKASTYVKDKFDDLTEELEDMFGLSREVQRRGGAIVQETGERIGQVRGDTGGITERGQAIKEYLGPEQFKTAKQFVSQLGGITDNFFSTVVGEMQRMEPGETAEEAVMRKIMEQILDVNLGDIQKRKDKVVSFYKRFLDAVQARDLTPEDLTDINLPLSYTTIKEWINQNESLTREQIDKIKQFRSRMGSVGNLLNKLPSTGHKIRLPKDKKDGGWLQGIVNFLKFWEAPKVQAAEGPRGQGQYGGLAGKIATTVQQLANATEDFTEQVNTLETKGITVSSEALGKISGGKTTEVTVDISQAFDNTFDLDISSDGIEGDTEAMIRRAISRATSELEQTVRSSVDPEALEQLVIEKIEDEVEKNEEGNNDDTADSPAEYYTGN